MLGEKLADAIFGRREGNGRAGRAVGSCHTEFACPEVEAYAAEVEHAPAHPALAAERRSHLRAQLRHAEGLAHVVVGAEAEAQHRVVLGDLGGEEHDGPVEAAPDETNQFEATETGHHHVGENEVIAGEVHRRDRSRVVGALDLVTVAGECPLEQLKYGAVVVDRKDASHRAPPIESQQNGLQFNQSYQSYSKSTRPSANDRMGPMEAPGRTRSSALGSPSLPDRSFKA